MSWLQISLPVTPADLNRVEDALFAAGAVSIALVSDADEPVLEPAPGETPLWQEISLQAVFAADADMVAVRQALAALAPGLSADVTFIGDADWQAAQQSNEVNKVFGGRLWLHPKKQVPPPEEYRGDADSLVQLRLDAGLAFGSGSHPTTALCLGWLAEQVLPGMRVLDFGCGSGVLGIAAALLGARAVAVDHDPQALLASRENASYNNLTHKQMTTLAPADWYARLARGEFEHKFDIVVANILATPLQELAEDFESVARPGAHIILSGILPEQAAEVSASYGCCVFEPARTEQGWALLQGRVGSPT